MLAIYFLQKYQFSHNRQLLTTSLQSTMASFCGFKDTIRSYLCLCSVDLIYDGSLELQVFSHGRDLFFGRVDVLV